MISREDQDCWTERSQKRALRRRKAAGKFADEIVPVEVRERGKPVFSRKMSAIVLTRRSVTDLDWIDANLAAPRCRFIADGV